MTSKYYVKHENGKRGVITGRLSDLEYRVVICDTGEEELWHYQSIYWLYLIPKEDW